ncbi:HPP family protein [Noviherbaspirillum galbum]|uniref:HPP family protein n=1 Tax=Noviherbaspirillum galbum TaxID=2709383 RepID=A0A6B3SNU3_9BURK|nr:HPP family protein [Noviherbaspirillum galbum]NEX62188.1 HPP family protein [Noviherbaspirillum galbum]
MHNRPGHTRFIQSAHPSNRNRETLLLWLKGFLPAPVHAGKRERLYSCMGACIGLLLTEWVSRTALGTINPWFIAPMGASAVLLFAAPSSLLAQPWSLLGGNLLSAFIGVSVAKEVPDPGLAAALAVGIAIAGMFSLRCLHPPSGAVALTAVLGGPSVTAAGYKFLWQPVALNSVLLLVVALVFNNVLRRRYPHAVVTTSNKHQPADGTPLRRIGFTREDMDKALQSHDELIDISEDDLEEILLQAELHAFQRRSGELRCADVMSRDVITINQSNTVGAAWKLLDQHQVHALPVVNESKVLVGIVTLQDLIETYTTTQGKSLPRLHREKPLDHVMTRQVQTVLPNQPITEVVSRALARGFLHLPVVDPENRVIGILTQSDLVTAVYRARLEDGMETPTSSANEKHLKLVK